MDRPDHLGQPIGNLSAMGPIRTFFYGMIGILVWSVLLLVSAHHISNRTEFGPEEAALPAEPPEASAANAAPQPEPVIAEADTPADQPQPAETMEPQVTMDAEELVNEAELPAAPLAQDESPEQERNIVMLPRPQTEQAGLLNFETGSIKLEGTIPTETERQCTGANGIAWPCGVVARTQQRLFLRSRTVACALEQASWQGEIETSCRIGNQDIAEWLVGNGWVEAAPGSALATLGEDAKKAGRGLFGTDPR